MIPSLARLMTEISNMEAPTQIQEQPVHSALPRNEGLSEASQTASEFIDNQLKLEADAREALPYAFDHCTNPLGSLRQNLFSCLTCNPPPTSPSEPYNPAGVCYSCSIACHGEHTLVELFARRNFTCDCGTTRLPSASPCTLRIDPTTGIKGPIHSQTPAAENTYNRNFQNRFCGCGEVYNAFEEKGTMFQCLGLATEQDGGCGEDWWHPECLLGLGRDWWKKAGDVVPEGNVESSAPLPPGFPQEEEFEVFICYKCVEANPWIKGYAGTEGFLRPVFKKDPALRADLPEKDNITPAKISRDLDEASSHVNAPTTNGEATTLEKVSKSEPSLQSPITVEKSSTPESSSQPPTTIEKGLNSEPSAQLSTNAPVISKKRKAEDDPVLDQASPHSDPKKLKTDPPPHHESLHPAPEGPFSIFLRENFRDHFCRCPSCYPLLRRHPQLLEEEDSYEPPLSQDGQEGGGESVGTGSLLDMGEAALSNVDRVRAIEGVMAYNHLKDKVKSFLQPFAESGTPVGAEDIKAYFEKLRGDDQAIKAAGGGAAVVAGRSTDDGGGGGGDGSESRSGAEGDGRREQSGY